MNKLTDQNGDYNFEGFTDLAEYCKVQMEKAPEHMKQYTSVEYFAESGVHTIEDFIKWELYGMISDLSKEANGFRLRFDWTQKSVEELQKDVEYYEQEAEAAFEREQKWQQEAVIEWHAHLKSLVSLGAKDFRQALNWDLAAEDCLDDPQGYGYYCYTKGLPYSKERVIERMLRAA
jgi:hypothetical protein